MVEEVVVGTVSFSFVMMKIDRTDLGEWDLLDINGGWPAEARVRV